MPYQLQSKNYKPLRAASPSELTQTGIVLSIILLPNGDGWQFQWPSTGAAFYRIVLRGRQIAIVPDNTNGLMTYNYDGFGFTTYPPPLEIMEENTVAPSELNRPFITIQWYGQAAVSYYLLQENISGTWTTMFEIGEIGAFIYSWSSMLLVDESTHTYRVIAYNVIGQPSDAMAFDITPVVMPPNFNESLYSVEYDGANIVFDLA